MFIVSAVCNYVYCFLLYFGYTVDVSFVCTAQNYGTVG
jgi:hypothetical protein